MESNFLSNMGLGNLDLGLVVFILTIVLFIAIITVIVLAKELSNLKKRYNRFCAGKNAKSLEEEIGTMFAENKAIRELTDKNKRDIRVIYHNLESTFCKVGLVRYDAFQQMGTVYEQARLILAGVGSHCLVFVGGGRAHRYLTDMQAVKCPIDRLFVQLVRSGYHESPGDGKLMPDQQIQSFNE